MRTMNHVCVYKMLRCSVAVMFICMAGQSMTNRKHNDQMGTSVKYNPIKADAGHKFFRRLIYDDESFRSVNEETICALVHFFIREAAQNGRFVHFSSGTFVLYDSTERFFNQLMMAKNAQIHSNEHRSGYLKRLQHFLFDLFKLIWNLFCQKPSSDELPLIYLRGDESSHFHERGNRHARWTRYPAYGMDFFEGCLPNQFLHILFGQLESLSKNGTHRGHRIYIKPEPYGLQRFRHYLGHTIDFLKTMLHFSACRWIDYWHTELCHASDVFDEWTDRRLLKRWTHILSTIESLSFKQRRQFYQEAVSKGIFEIYRQTQLFPQIFEVFQFQKDLESRFGTDIGSRKGNEIIFTTEQLLQRSSRKTSTFDMRNSYQCQITEK